MQKPPTKKPTRRKRATTLEPPVEKKVAADEAVEQVAAAPPTEEPTPARDTPSLGAGEEIPLAEVILDLPENGHLAHEPAPVYFRRVREDSGIAARVKESTLAPLAASLREDDRGPTRETIAFHASGVSGTDAQAVSTHPTPIPDSLPLEAAPLDLPLPPLPVLLFALILLGLAFF